MRLAAASAAFLLVLLMIASPAVVLAAPYEWDGGHDVLGWAAPAEDLFFAEGTTRNGFEEYLLVRNPGEAATVARIEYQFPAEEPVAQEVGLAPGGGAAIRVNDKVGPGRDVSIAVHAKPGIIAERQIYFNYLGVWTGGHTTSGVGAPASKWYFAEGTTRSGFHEWLCLQNPQDSNANVNVTYLLGTGENITKGMVIDARSRATVDVRGAVGLEQDVAVIVESDRPVVAERPMYFDYKSSWRGGHVVAGSPTLAKEWYFAEGTTREGFEEWLCVMNPGADTSARVEYMFSDSPSIVRDYTLRGGARTTIGVNQEAGAGKDVSIKLTAGAPVLCERPMYFLYHGELEGGHVVMGSTSGQKTWLFPEAATGTGFQSWLCLMNPGDNPADVTVLIRGDAGGRRERVLAMAPSARLTLDLVGECQGITNPWVTVTSLSEVIAERPSYFSYEPKVTSEPFDIASWYDVKITSPIRFSDFLGAQFHEASAVAGDGVADEPQAMWPMGLCFWDDNAAHHLPGLAFNQYGEGAFWIEESRGRGTYSTSACDVQSKAGAPVFAPVSGTVIVAEPYMLYGAYPDLRVRIAIEGHPGFHVAVLHMSQLTVAAGQRVEAGKTQIGVVRDLVPYFYSGPNPYTRSDGNHAHIQINYRPDIHL